MPQPVPSALGPGGSFLTTQPVAIEIAPAGGGAGPGTPVAPDAPFPANTPGGLQALPSTLTRVNGDTTPYSQYDLIADSLSAAQATPILNAVRSAGECFRWEGMRLRSSNASAKGKTFRVHLWAVQPTLSANDNGVFNAGGLQVLAVADIVGYVGYLDVTLTEAGAAGAAGRAVLSDPRTVTPNSGTTLWWTLEQRDATGYSPISAEIFAAHFWGQWS